jgi:hypothetical protein
MPQLAHVDEVHVEGRDGAMLEDHIGQDTWSSWGPTDRSRDSYEATNATSEPFLDRLRSRNPFHDYIVPVGRRKDHSVGYGQIPGNPVVSPASLGHLFSADAPIRQSHLQPDHAFAHGQPSILPRFQPHAFDELVQRPYTSLWSSSSESGSDSHSPVATNELLSFWFSLHSGRDLLLDDWCFPL